MKIVSNELKIALKQPTTQRKGRILVNGNYYEVYNVEYYADAYNEGNVIGNAIASQLDFDLPYMDKFETFKYYDGVWTGAKYEYVDMGTFTVFDEQDEDEFNKHITAFDNLIKFNKQFEDVGGYPKTLYQELKNICNQAEVELQNASIPNGNFSVENNQFVEGENLKTVLKAIEQISGTYGIIKNDKLVLQLKNQTSEKINKNEHEPIIWKRRTYGINQVVLGMEDVQGEYVLRQDDEDIAINGIHKLVINDNPFVYTQQKREQVIDELFNQVKGFGYVPYDLKMEWLNYMDIGDTISIDGIETLILRMYGKSPKSLESEMSAPAIIDSAVEYSNNTFSLTKRVSRTEFGVDKNAKEIQGIIETTEDIQKEINPTGNATGSNIYLEDASNNPLISLAIEGKSEQETRSGKNILGLKNGTYSNNGLTAVVNNGEVIINGTSTDIAFVGINVNPVNLIKGKNYTISLNNSVVLTENDAFRLNNSTTNQAGFHQANRTKTITQTEDLYVTYITARISSGVTLKDFTFKPQIELGSTATEWEQYGASPSPDYPSEIESVGYENLYQVAETQTVNGVTLTKNNDCTFDLNGTATEKTEFSIYVPINESGILNNEIYTLSKDSNYNFRVQVAFYNGSTWVRTPLNLAPGSPLYVTNTIDLSNITRVRYIITVEKGASINLSNVKIQLEKGETPHSFVPYDKYGIEVKTIGKNIFNYIDGFNDSINGLTNTLNTDGSITVSGIPTGSYTQIVSTHNINDILEDGQTYVMSETNPNSKVYMEIRRKNKSTGANHYISITSGSTYRTFTVNKTTYDYTIYLATTSIANWGTESLTITNTYQLEKGEIPTEFSKHQKNTLLITLNKQPRSLPNGVKDIAYIKNNKLYDDINVGSIILDGSEEWKIQSTWSEVGQLTNAFYTPKTSSMNMASNANKISSHFIYKTALTNIDEEGFFISSNIVIRVPKSISTVDELKTWLSTNNVQIDYELAEPYTEELGEIEIPSTFKGANHIITTDELEPTINIEYVRDTIIGDYVENHVAELKITENEIKESVQTVSSSVDGLNSTINRVEEITTDNSQVINIITTNIDKNSGEVREVTTTTGFTFNKDGMTIDDGSGFKAEHRANGTYYKDGTKVTGQYTKDGSKQKDLQLFGVYSYGMKDIDDTPMFIGQLYNDATGEECFGHFYNGG